MTTREYLEQLFDITDRAEICLAEAEKWHEIATSLSVSYDKEPVKSSGNKQKMESAAVNAVYYEQKAKEEALKHINRREEIVEQIKAISGNNLYRRILYKHYAEKKPLVTVAVEIGYSDSHTRREYRKSLKEFEKQYGRLYMSRNEQK